MEWRLGQPRRMPGQLERLLGLFVRQKRGNRTYAEFSKKIGLPPSTLHRLEMGQQSITLTTSNSL